MSTPHPSPTPPPHSDAPASTQTPLSTAPAPPPPGGRLARLIVVLCFTITFLATALIYWRWANVAEPSSYVVVEGAEEHNGTVITVSTIEAANDVVATATLSSQNNYAVTIFLNPGDYRFSAFQHGNTLVETRLLVPHRRFKVITLRKRSETGAAAVSSARS